MPANDTSQDKETAGPGAALIVEDNVIIALEIETFLQDFGIANSFIAGTVENALLILEAREIVFAIVDVTLGQETSEEVAVALQARGVPFVFATGYDAAVPMLERFAGVPALMKPFSATMLHRALTELGIC